MMKRFIYIVLSIFLCIDVFYISKAIRTFTTIDNYPEKTALVVKSNYKRERDGNGKKRGRRASYTYRLQLRLRSLNADEEKKIYTIELNESAYALRKLPDVKTNDTINYRTILNPSVTPEIIGLSTQNKKRSPFQTFLDVYRSCRKSFWAYLPLMLTCVLLIPLSFREIKQTRQTPSKVLKSHHIAVLAYLIVAILLMVFI